MSHEVIYERINSFHNQEKLVVVNKTDKYRINLIKEIEPDSDVIYTLKIKSGVLDNAEIIVPHEVIVEINEMIAVSLSN